MVQRGLDEHPDLWSKLNGTLDTHRTPQTLEGIRFKALNPEFANKNACSSGLNGEIRCEVCVCY